jgi:hypothetical protein
LSDVTPLLSGSWARLGPITSSSTDEKPCGSHIDKPLSISWLKSKAFLFLQVSPGETSLIRVLLKGNLKVVFLKKSLSDVRFFGEKGHSLSVAPSFLLFEIKSWRVLKIMS